MMQQMTFIPQERFERPLRWREDHYVPILKSLKGERDALKEAAAATWDRISPLIEATGRAGVDEPPARSGFPNLIEHLGPAIKAGRPFFLDFPQLDSNAKVNVGSTRRRTAVNVVEYIFDGCRKSGLTFIPVLSPRHDAGRSALVAAALKRDGRGLCLRMPIGGVVWENGIDSTIERLLKCVGARPAEVDLLLDLSYITSPPGFAATHIKRLIERLPGLDAWRSLVLAGTAIPPSASGIQEDGITGLPRHEWQLYRELRQLAPARIPTFADYAVQHPEPPAEGGGPGMRTNIRYTTEELLLFARGHSVLEDSRGQYRKLCQMLVSRPEFYGADYTWGDGIIARTATSSCEPSASQQQWRGAGTSHHLRIVAEAIAGL